MDENYNEIKESFTDITKLLVWKEDKLRQLENMPNNIKENLKIINPIETYFIPYCKKDIIEFQDKYNIKFPVILYLYLIKISKYVFKYGNSYNNGFFQILLTKSNIIKIPIITNEQDYFSIYDYKDYDGVEDLDSYFNSRPNIKHILAFKLTNTWYSDIIIIDKSSKYFGEI